MYNGREPGKICYMRYDTLARMLTLGNIHAGGKVLVFETCAGLVLGAVMERMGGYGSVVQMYPGDRAVRPGVESFGFPPHFHAKLHEFPICHVNALLAGTLDCQGAPAKEPAAGNSSTSDTLATTTTTTTTTEASKAVEETAETDKDTQGGGGGGGGEGGSPEESMMETSTADQEAQQKLEIRLQEKKAKMEEKRKKLAAARPCWRAGTLTGGYTADGTGSRPRSKLIIASKYHPSEVLLGLIQFLAPSRPFVVYSQFKEPLIECYTKLKEQGGVVLPNRTHPVLVMSGGGGYLLAGTTVDTRRAKPAAVPQADGPPAPKRLKLTGSEG
ncbi:hypothetical protein CRUP_031785 [Coryphaenoides rupestris]|nr:hypothetical protein CRUP_031785 [Coryphaenoides rupestris]